MHTTFHSLSTALDRTPRNLETIESSVIQGKRMSPVTSENNLTNSGNSDTLFSSLEVLPSQGEYQTTVFYPRPLTGDPKQVDASRFWSSTITDACLRREAAWNSVVAAQQ